MPAGCTATAVAEPAHGTVLLRLVVPAVTAVDVRLKGEEAVVVGEGLRIPPDRRRCGWGTRIVRAVWALVARLGARRLWLMQAPEVPTPFYLKVGFRWVEKAVLVLGEDPAVP